MPSRHLRDHGVDYLGRNQYIDWNGELKTTEEFDFPREVTKGDTGYVVRVIETSGPWEGHVVVILGLRGRFARSKLYPLPFRVTDDGADDVPFLRRPEVA